MNAQTNIKRTNKALLACYSFRGHDFFEDGKANTGAKSTRWAKRVTSKAARRHNKALCRV